MKSLESIVHSFRGKRVLVIGDLVADVFVYGEISRISREAPVLILRRRRTELVPGGGGNAVHNLRTLGAQPVPVGVVGNDAEGKSLVAFLRKLGIDTTGITVDRRYETPAKTRILAWALHSYRQQVVRLDSGSEAIGAATLRAVRSRVRQLIDSVDAVLISDYGYGLVTPDLVELIRDRALPVTVDSRFGLQNFTGLTAATPNEAEAEAALDLRIGNSAERLETAGRKLLRRLKHQALLVTRGKEGMALFQKGRPTLHIPIYGTDEIADVTGAGDTVIATFTLGLAAGASFEAAARLANFAGGIVVMKYGTCAVTAAELAQAARQNGDLS